MELKRGVVSIFLMNIKTRIRQRAEHLSAIMFAALGDKHAPFVFLKKERLELTTYLARRIAESEIGKRL